MSNKQPFIKFTLWLFVLFLIIIIGITNVFAETYDAYLFNAQLYDNNNGSLSTVSTSFGNNYWQGTIPNMTANSSGAAWGISSPIPLIANHTYTLTVNIGHEYGNTVLSTYNRIGVGSSFNEARISYQNNTNVVENLSKVQSLVYGQGLQFAFTPSISGNYIVFPFATSLSGTNVKFTLNQITIDDIGSSGVSETTINNSLNNQTNIINGNITNSENNIKNNSNANRDAIINNQNANNDALIENDNANTDKIIEDNKKNFQTCRDSVNLFNPTAFESGLQNNKIRNDEGTVVSDSTSSYSTYTIQVEAGQLYSIHGYFQRVYFLNSSQQFVSRIIYNSSTTLPMNSTYTPSEDGYFQFQIRNSAYNSNKGEEQVQKGSFTQYEEYGSEICSNKLDEQTNAINGLNDSINNDNVDDSDIGDAFDDFNDFLDDNSTITQLITLPVTLYTAILNNLNGSCSPFNLGNLFGTDLILPCINISQYLGNSLWTMIDIIISGFAIYEIAKKFIKVFNNLSSLREGDVIDD